MRPRSPAPAGAVFALGLTLALAAGCGGPLISNFNNSFDGEKGQRYAPAAGFAPADLGRVLVLGPFDTGPRGPIICCARDAITFATKLHEVTGAPVRLVTVPNGAHASDYRPLLENGSAARLAEALGTTADFDTVIFGSVVEHEAFLRAVHGYSADITLAVTALDAHGKPRFEAASRVQYPADTIGRESSKVIAELVAGRR